MSSSPLVTLCLLVASVYVVSCVPTGSHRVTNTKEVPVIDEVFATNADVVEQRVVSAEKSLGLEASRVKARLSQVIGVNPGRTVLVEARKVLTDEEFHIDGIVDEVHSKGPEFAKCSLRKDAEKDEAFKKAFGALNGCSSSFHAEIRSISHNFEKDVDSAASNPLFPECFSGKGVACVDKKTSDSFKKIGAVESHWTKRLESEVQGQLTVLYDCLKRVTASVRHPVEHLENEVLSCDTETAKHFAPIIKPQTRGCIMFCVKFG